HGFLLNMEDYPFYSNFNNYPTAQLPTGLFKSSSGIKALVSEFEARGCDVVLTGQGGDTLFVDEIRSLEKLKFNIDDEFICHEERDLFYSPRKISLISFYAHRPIINVISNARIGRTIDPLKIWARNWFKDFLPRELVEYSYCADFQARTMWGLEEAKPTIKKLMDQAGEYLKHPLFYKKNINRFINKDVFAFEPSEYILFCSSLAIAVWVNSLLNYEE
ncbi:MAG: hypothetical protein K2K70_13300, partial [Lachnospiraceae bacterium]|nr:hypothetical protein [Lachnospiraceae bacterium]